MRLLHDGQTVSFVVDDGEVTAVHLQNTRLEPAAIEELNTRLADGDYLGEEIDE